MRGEGCLTFRNIAHVQLGIRTSMTTKPREKYKRNGLMAGRIYAKSFSAKPTNVAPAASIPKPSNEAFAALVEPEPVEEFPEVVPDPVELEDPLVGDVTPPLRVVVPLMSGQVSIYIYVRKGTLVVHCSNV